MPSVHEASASGEPSVRSFLFTLGAGAAALVGEYDADPAEAYDAVAVAAGFDRWETLYNEWNEAVAKPPQKAAQYILNLPTAGA